MRLFVVFATVSGFAARARDHVVTLDVDLNELTPEIELESAVWKS